MTQPPGQSGSIVFGPACSRCGKRIKTADDVLVECTSITGGGYVNLKVCVPCLVEWQKDVLLAALKTDIETMIDKAAPTPPR